MKILYYTDLFIPFVGGNESFLANIESRLGRGGHKTIHITSGIYHMNGEDTEMWDDKPIKVKRCWIPFSDDFLGKGRYFFPFTSIRTAVKEAKNYDIIVATTFIAGLSGWLVGKLARKPVLLYAHEMFGDLWKQIGENPIQKYIYPLIEKFIVRRYDMYGTPTEYGKQTLINAGANPEKITIINHGVDPQFHKEIDGSELRKKHFKDDDLVFGFSGRLKIKGTGQSKGIPDLLRAAKIVFEEIPNSKLALGGSDFEVLEPLIAELGIKERVVYTGKLSFQDVPKFHRMCDVIAGASIAEGFGLFYAEASRCGRAVAATKAGAIPEVIKDGETGLLSEPRKPQKLAQNIIKLLKNKELRDSMGDKGAEYTKKFDWERSVKEHIELYKRVI